MSQGNQFESSSQSTTAAAEGSGGLETTTSFHQLTITTSENNINWPFEEIIRTLDMQYNKLPLTAAAEKVFVAKIRDYYDIVSNLYYNPKFIAKVKDLVPHESLKKKALDLAQYCSESSKKTGDDDDSTLSTIQQSKVKKPLDPCDFLAIELMEWFNCNFFKWFDTPLCSNVSCPLRGLKMDSLGSAHPTLDDLNWGASRVELYACSACQSEYRFPRYNNPLKLMDSRVGRCGEWANCFTAILVALGYEARLILDWTDHVWTEYYSTSQNRWIHLDSCEKAVDSPLTYEQGWQKKLTYCIAFSRFDIQDVTWRYVSEPEPVLARRTQADEQWLTTFLLVVNRKIRSMLPPKKQQELLKRTANELAEMLFMPGSKKNVSSDELVGRKSGSLDWRAARSELGSNNVVNEGYIFNVSRIMEEDSGCNFCEIQYNSVSDEYSIGKKEKRKGWSESTYSYKNLAKKIERDWRMVYLARKEGSPSNSTGEICWKIDLTGVNWRTIDVQLKGALYQNGVIDLTISTDCSNFKIHLPVNKSNSILRNQFPPNTNNITITASLSNGNGTLAWQHAQLFRQSIDRESQTNSFLVRILTS